MLKVLHTADWHIGNFPGPASRDGKNLRFGDICAYIEFLIDKAKTLSPDIIIIAGDVFNQAKTWSDRGLQETNTLINYIAQLADIAPTCVLRGTPNHDGKMHFDLLSTALGKNSRVYIIDEPCVKNIDNLAAVTFVPIFNKNLYRAEAEELLDKEAENNFFCDKVRDAILDLKKEADAMNLPTILVTHYTVLGAIMPNGQTSIFANQEVVIDPITLIQSDYWLTCLGHIHKPQQIETCNNVFYSGSLCSLSFNDENDPHGFYMHYITDHDNIQSEFIETPCRRFHTIWFDDNQLNNIISNDYDLTPYLDGSMQGDIIRVIYTCMDVTNKKLNKALLEKALYAQTGAFFVQEITPADIAITVDKTAMRNTTSIEDNLRLFLKNEQIEHSSIIDSQIEDCIQLAKPIIDEISASVTVNQNIGVMTPIEIEVKNYRNYKDAVFNYKDVKFCVINGDNGAGKSSLFMDAMLDALFEETREGDITGWINNNINVRSGSIKYTFSIGDNIYKISRTRQKSGKATLNLAQLCVDENGDETWVDLSEEHIKDTQAVINKLIGMDAVTLKSCGLIMQDAYGLFLQADKTVRMNILGNILGLNIYNDLSDSVAEFSQICQRELTKATDEENNILAHMKNGEEIVNNLNDANDKKSECERDLKTCSEEFAENTRRRETLVKNAENYTRLCGEIEALNVKKLGLENAQQEQRTIINNADVVISKESELAEKTKRHNELTALSQTMEAKSETIQSLMAMRRKLESDINLADNVIADADNKINVLSNKVHEIEIELSSADDIANKANLYEKTKSEIADIEARMENISALEAQRRSKQLELNSINHDFETKTTDFNVRLAEIDRKIATLAESGCSIAAEQSTCKFLADARQAIIDKPILIDSYNQHIAAYSQSKTAIENEINTLTANIDALKTNLPDLALKKQELAVYESCAFKMASIPELKNTLAAYNQQIEDFKAIKADNERNKASLIDQFNENTKTVSTYTAEIARYDNVKAELAKIGDINELSNSIAAAKTAKTTAENRIAEITKEIQLIDFDVFDKARERSMLNFDSVAISEVDAHIHACQTRQELLNQNLTEIGKIIGRLELEMKEYNADVRQLEKLKQLKDKMSYTASNAGWLKKAFNRNGIPHNIVRSVIPVLETTASNILNQMSNNSMSIELRTEKLLTTKKEVATLDVIVCDTVTGDLPYLSRSGGERVKAALSIVLALAEIKSSESGIQLGFLFIDEPPFLDSNGIDAYCDALEAIQKRYSDLKIMAITHDPEMKSRFAQSIEVYKTDEGSEVLANL